MAVKSTFFMSSLSTHSSVSRTKYAKYERETDYHCFQSVHRSSLWVVLVSPAQPFDNKHTNAFHFKCLARLDSDDRRNIRATRAFNRLMMEVVREAHVLPAIVESLQ